MAKSLSHQLGHAQRTIGPPRDRLHQEGGPPTAKARILEKAAEVRILDAKLSRELIRNRQESGVDKYDEVWEGVYVVPPLANNPHQNLVLDLAVVLHGVITGEGRGRVQAGANVSDRRHGWEHNFRDPDIVVVLNNSRAIDCTTHWLGGPDFLVEIRSKGDETDAKIPFYGQLKVQELLIIDRDTRQLQLYRRDGQQLGLVESSAFQGGKWLMSKVVPLAFRRKTHRGQPQVDVRRSDGQTGSWSL